MVWEIPEETLKPSDKRSAIYQYINISKRIMVANAPKGIKESLVKLLERQGYLVEEENSNEISQYYEGLIYFSMNSIDTKEEEFIKNFASKLSSESSIVIVDYNKPKRNEIEKKLATRIKERNWVKNKYFTFRYTKR